MQSHVSKNLVRISTCQFSHKLITHEISYSHLPIHAVKSIINGPKSAHHIDNKDISTPSLRCYRIHEGCIRVFIIIIYTTRHHNSQTAFYNQSFNLFCAKWTKLYGFSFWNSTIYWWAIIILWVFILLFVLYLTHLCQRVNIKYHIKTHKMFYCTKGNLK